MGKPASDDAGRTSPSGDPLVAEVVSAVGRMYRRVRSERVGGELGDAALAVLTLLQRSGPKTLSALSEHERVTPASMSQTVNRLTSLGYAVRGSDPQDGRKVLFSATDQGSELAIRERTQRHIWMAARLAELSAADREILARAAGLLTAIADSER